MALWAGRRPDRHGVPSSSTRPAWSGRCRCAGLLVTEGVRGDGGVLRNSEGKRFMFDYVADMFRAETAESEEEADRWYDDHTAGRRPPELLPRDEVARAINTEVKAGRGSPHGGVFLDIASRRSAEYIRRRLPSMYHQFMELAGVDITAEADGGRPDLPLHHGRGPGGRRHRGGHRARAVRRRRGGRRACTAPTGSGGNSLSDLLVFGRRAGIGAVRLRRGPHRRARRSTRPRWTAVVAEALAPFDRTSGENPYDVQHDLQETMQDLVGIIRTGPELDEALEQARRADASGPPRSRVAGGRAYNPGWNLATDLPAMLTVSTLRDPGRPRPQGEPGRPHPGGLPERRPRARQGQLRPAPADRRRAGRGDQDHPRAPPRRCRPELQALFEEGH